MQINRLNKILKEDIKLTESDASGILDMSIIEGTLSKNKMSNNHTHITIAPWKYIILKSVIKIPELDIELPLPTTFNIKNFIEQKPFIQIHNKKGNFYLEIPTEE